MDRKAGRGRRRRLPVGHRRAAEGRWDNDLPGREPSGRPIYPVHADGADQRLRCRGRLWHRNRGPHRAKTGHSDGELPSADRSGPGGGRDHEVGHRDPGGGEGRGALGRMGGDQRGFTLAELLVVMALTGLVLAGVFAIQQRGTSSYLMGASRVEVQQNARTALELMIRELRSAESVTTLASATDITFVDVTGATVRYQLTGTTLNRTAAGGGGVLIGGRPSLPFSSHATCVPP